MRTGGTENKAEKRTSVHKAIIYRYQGGGFIPGIPPRDVTQEEAKRLEIEQVLENSKLYLKEGE